MESSTGPSAGEPPIAGRSRTAAIASLTVAAASLAVLPLLADSFLVGVITTDTYQRQPNCEDYAAGGDLWSIALVTAIVIIVANIAMVLWNYRTLSGADRRGRTIALLSFVGSGLAVLLSLTVAIFFGYIAADVGSPPLHC